jgi:hypothetical protein
MSALTFLLSAMNVLKTKNPLTESFIVQLDVDLEGANLDIPSHARYKYGPRVQGEVPVNTDAVHCVPVYEIRESQSLGQGDRQFTGPDKSFHNPWPSDNNLFGTNGRANDRHEKLPHIGPPPDFSTDDPLLYNNPTTSSHPSRNNNPTNSNSSNGPSPNFSADNTSSHSGQPTPSTTSLPYHESTPPNLNSFTPSSFFIPSHTKPQQNGASRFTTTGFFDATNPMALHAQQNTFATGMPQAWNFQGMGQNESASANNNSNNTPSSNGQSQSQGQQQQQQSGEAPTPGAGAQSEFNFGRTGMTPGATGMTPLPESLWQHADGGGDWMGFGGGWGNGN